MTACEITDLDKRVNPNAASPENLDANFLINAIQTNVESFFVTASNASMDVTRMNPMTGGNIYDNGWSPNTFDFMWNRAYQGVLVNIQLLEDDQATSEVQLVNYLGMSKLIKAYVMMTLVDFFGDVPMTDALQGTSNLSPGRDPGADVYAAAGAAIEEAIALFNTPDGTEGVSFSMPNTDLFFDGDVDSWLAAAYAMKMKYHLSTRLSGGSGTEFSSAATAWQALIDGGASGDFAYYYGASRATPNARHPWYNEQYEAGNGRYHSNFYIWNFRAEGPTGMDDPRIRYYFYRQDWDYTDAGKWNQFTLDFVDFSDFSILNTPAHYPAGMPFGMATATGNIIGAEGYYGRDHGNNDGIPPDGLLRVNWGVYPAGGKFDAGDPNDPDSFSDVKNNGVDGATGLGVTPFMMESYVYFMRAEAALSMGTGEDAEAMFTDGVQTSIDNVIGFANSVGQGGDALQPTDSVVTVYVDNAVSMYNAAADPMDIVQFEYWKALWGNGIESYNAYRRTGMPAALFPGGEMQPTRDTDPGVFPRTMFYPAVHVNLNGAADQRTDLSEQVFWDTNASFPE